MAGATRSTVKKPAVTRCGTSDSGSAPASRSVSQPLRDRGHGLEHALLGHPVEVVLWRNEGNRIGIVPRSEHSAGAQLPLTNGDEAIVLVEREAAKDHGVHDREDRGRRADPERQDDERGRQ